MFAHRADVGKERLFGGRALVAGRAQHGRRMHGREYRRRPFRFDRRAALLHHAERAAEQDLGGGGAEADDELRLDDVDFGLQPRAARGDLARGGF